jgi:putative ABC transport system permease protein
VGTLVAWRILMHEGGRTVLTVGGIYIAILMIFLQLGFYYSVPKGGMTVYEAMRFDLLLTSSAYLFQGQSLGFPRRRIQQVLALPEVASVTPVYQNSGEWLNPDNGTKRDVFVMAFPPGEAAFAVAGIEQQIDAIRRPDTILVDDGTRPEFGPLIRGRLIEIDNRAVQIAGTYALGPGFVGLGVAVTSDLNFIRMFPERSLAEPNLGLVRLKPGADAQDVAAQLRAILAADTHVFTRDELAQHEVAHWVTRTSTGIVFGFGVIVSVVVGTVILYQTLATHVLGQLPQYATLKALGYTHLALERVVVALALIMAAAAYIPALASAAVLYRLIRNTTLLPIEMTESRIAVVFAATLAMSAASALLSVWVVRRADPADLF